MRVFTVGHGARGAEELVACLVESGVRTLVDVRRYPASRRHPQFNGPVLAGTVAAAGIGYTHAVELGGRREGEPGEERFACIGVPAFRSYAARMASAEWQAALAHALAEPEPCFLCAETLWKQCHRRMIADLLHARGHEVVHLLRPGHTEPHRLWEPAAEARDGRLYLCGTLVG